jgi:hypothetical protein
MNPLQPTETVLTGTWIKSEGLVVGDDTCRRIEWLINSRLERVAVASSGWDVLYRDPGDGRLWERTYPQSDSHGGGPPKLKVVGQEIASQKYGL